MNYASIASCCAYGKSVRTVATFCSYDSTTEDRSTCAGSGYGGFKSTKTCCYVSFSSDGVDCYGDNDANIARKSWKDVVVFVVGLSDSVDIFCYASFTTFSDLNFGCSGNYSGSPFGAFGDCYGYGFTYSAFCFGRSANCFHVSFGCFFIWSGLPFRLFLTPTLRSS